MNIRIAAAVAATLFLSACATTDQPRLDAGRSLQINAPQKDVKAAVAAMMTSDGWTIGRDSDFVLSFEKPSTNFWATVLLSSNYDTTVDSRVQFTFIGDKPTQLSWNAWIVTNPGSAFERLTDMTNNAANDPLEVKLEGIQTNLEKK